MSARNPRTVFVLHGNLSVPCSEVADALEQRCAPVFFQHALAMRNLLRRMKEEEKQLPEAMIIHFGLGRPQELSELLHTLLTIVSVYRLSPPKIYLSVPCGLLMQVLQYQTMFPGSCHVSNLADLLRHLKEDGYIENEAAAA